MSLKSVYEVLRRDGTLYAILWILATPTLIFAGLLGIYDKEENVL